MSASNVEVTHAAEHDLIEIGLYTQTTWGRTQCRRYLTRLDRAFGLLGRGPWHGKPAGVDGFLRYRVGKHLIFYEVDTQGAVLIVRVLHQRMLPAPHFR